MNGKRLDKVLVTTLFIFLIVAPLVSAELIPHGIKGTVYLSDGVTPAPRGTNFSINDTTSGYYLQGLTGGPSLPGDPFSGFYSASIVGEDGDEVIIKAWNATYYGITVITLAGDMAEIDVIINTPLQDINQPPVSDPNGPYTDTEGVSVTFDGSGSSDPDGSIVSYAWNFGDSSTGTGMSPTHTYAQNGTYIVMLTVTDEDEATNTSTTTATIGDIDQIYNVSFLPPIINSDIFNLKNGTTLPIKFTARDYVTGEFVNDDRVNVTITNSTGHLITYFTNGTGTDSVRIDTEEEQYITNFHTKDYDLNVGETYAVTVTFGEPDSLRDMILFTLL